jgi:hypothetical protein
MINRLVVMDFDGTLVSSIMPEEGKKVYELYYKKPFPWKGWWSKPESLDLNIFDIKPFPEILNILNKEKSKPDTYVVILTSRLEKLRPYVQAVLDKNNIRVDKLDMKYNEKTKGQKVLDYIQNFPNLTEINVYDDKESDILSYKEIEFQITENIIFKIFLTTNGHLNLVENKYKNVLKLIQEEIIFFTKI